MPSLSNKEIRVMTAARSWWKIWLFPLVFWLSVSIAGCGKPTLQTITIEPASATLTVGETVQFRAVALDKKGRPIKDVAFTWAVDGANGRIDAQGLFTALKPGTSTVTVTSGPVTGTATLAIEREKVANLAALATPSEVVVGQAATLTVTAKNAQGQGIADVPVQAQPTSQDTQITPATANTDASGQATFTLTAARQVQVNQVELRADNQQATVTVQGRAGAPAALQVTPATAAAVVGEEVPLQLTVHDEAGNPVPSQQVHITAVSTGTTVEPTDATTDAQGEASAVIRTSTGAGTNRLRLEVSPLPPGYRDSWSGWAPGAGNP